MQKIKVARKEMKETTKGNTMVAVFDEKNVRFSGFLPELKDIIEGDTIEAEIEVFGKYNNIKAVKFLSHGEAPDKPPAKTYNQDSPEKRRSIERQTAAQIAFEHGINEEDTLDKPTPWSVRQALTQAEQIYQWIANGTIPPPLPSSTSEKQATASLKPPPPSLPQITPESVYAAIKKLLSDKVLDGEELKALFEGVGALGEKTSEKLKSLSMENLLKVSARVNQTLTSKKSEPIEDILF